MPWLLACASPPPPVPVPAAEPERVVEVVLDRGHFDGDDWVSEPVGADRLVSPRVAVTAGEGGTLARGWATLPLGEARAVVERAGCGRVTIPYRVGAEATVLLPYPACGPVDAMPIYPGGRPLGRAEVTAAEVRRVQVHGLLPGVPAPEPGAEDGPARWVTWEEASTWCAWWGGELPGEDELASLVAGDPVLNGARDRLGDGPLGVDERRRAGWEPPSNAAGHLDLVGNVAEWLRDGTIAGGSWVDRAPLTRRVPPNARTDTIGFRCVWPA